MHAKFSNIVHNTVSIASIRPDNAFPPLEEVITEVKKAAEKIPKGLKEGFSLQRKLDGSLVTEVDQGIQQHLKTVLKEALASVWFHRRGNVP